MSIEKYPTVASAILLKFIEGMELPAQIYVLRRDVEVHERGDGVVPPPAAAN